MASTHPLLHARPADVTIERVRALVRQVGPESTVVEYKEQFAETIAKSVAALANTYGGLLLIGVTDQRVVKGVKEKTIESVADHCSSKIEPPYVPEIIPVPLGQSSDLYVLVLRVVPEMHIRPLLVDGIAWVRHQNTSHPADWARLRDLFAEGASGGGGPEGPWNVAAPQSPTAANGSADESVDFVIRSGLTVAVAPQSTWRPTPELVVQAYIQALNDSSLAVELGDLVILGGTSTAGISPFEHRGFNRSRTIRLEWTGSPAGWPADCPPAVEACARLQVPGAYGHYGTRLEVEIDVTVRFSAAAIAQSALPLWRVNAQQLFRLMDAMLETLTCKAIVANLAELAGVDPLAVAQPRALHLVTVRPVTDVLDTAGLHHIPESGNSRGAHLLADPARDLADANDRSIQVNDWLVQLALDSGLLGMTRLLAHL